MLKSTAEIMLESRVVWWRSTHSFSSLQVHTQMGFQTTLSFSNILYFFYNGKTEFHYQSNEITEFNSLVVTKTITGAPTR